MIIICAFLIYFCRKKIIHILIIVLLFIINLRIMIPSKNYEALTNNLDVLFVIDNTISMTALDYNNGPRLDAVKKDCDYIINYLSGANFSVITFDNKARLQVPFTADINMVSNSINALNPIDETYAKGSTLNVSLDLMEEYLSSSLKNERAKILFFISDGEITNESKLKSFSKLKKYVSDGVIMGYGTKEGGKMLIYDKYNDKSEYLTYLDKDDYKRKEALSIIDESNLKKIASDIGIDYLHMDGQKKISNKLKSIKENTNYHLESSDKSSYDDIYFIFVIPLLLLLLVELNKYRRIIL